jgi:translation initiation factor 2 subunit 1
MEALANHPFYTNSLPQKDDIVIAEVVDFNDVRVNLLLLEYGRVKAFLPTSEINVRRGKRVKDYVKQGQEIAVQVINVSKENDTGTINIDVSLKVVKADETKEFFDKYHKALKVHKTIGAATQYKPEEAQKMYEMLWGKYETDILYPVFEEIRAGVRQTEDIPVTLVKAIEERMPATLFTQEAEMIITFPKEKNGAEKVVAKLDRLSQMEGVKVFVVAPPKYKIVVSSQTKAKAEELLQQVLDS